MSGECHCRPSSVTVATCRRADDGCFVQLVCLKVVESTVDKAISETEKLDREFTTMLFGQSEQPGGNTSRRALVVEDDANESELLAGYLQMSG